MMARLRAQPPVARRPVSIGQITVNADQFKQLTTNPLRLVTEHPISTFSIDVDTSSYSFVRRQLQQMDTLPQKEQVRLEEMVNYFDYQYRQPQSTQIPFEPNITVLPSPWARGKKLLHIGIKGHQAPANQQLKSNLVFLIDTSGSMTGSDKLPLLVKSFKLLVNHLNKDSSIAIVTYAGSAGLVLEPTKVSQKVKILAALERLQAGGSTAGAQGIQLAYATAKQNFF